MFCNYFFVYTLFKLIKRSCTLCKLFNVFHSYSFNFSQKLFASSSIIYFMVKFSKYVNRICYTINVKQYQMYICKIMFLLYMVAFINYYVDYYLVYILSFTYFNNIFYIFYNIL